MVSYTPYFYIIEYKPTSQYYAGIRISKKSTYGDILKSYFTSSKYVKQLMEEDTADNFIVRKLKKFSNVDDCREYEVKFLKKVNAIANPRFLNKSNSGTASKSGMDYISDINKNKVYYNNGEDTIWLTPSDSIPDGYTKGKLHTVSEETKSKISNTLKKKRIMPKTCQDERSAEYRANLSKSIKGKTKGYKWINDGVNNTKVHYSELQTYIDNGWQLGRASYRRG